MKRQEAIEAAQNILRDEANSLALLSHEKSQWDALPHRARCAVQLEITRLRTIADRLEPQTSDEAILEDAAREAFIN